MKKLIWCLLLVCGITYATVQRPDGIWELENAEVERLTHLIDKQNGIIGTLEWQNSELATQLWTCKNTKGI